MTNAGEDAEKRNTVSGTINSYSHYGDQYEGPQITKNRSVTWSSYPTSESISKENEMSITKRYLRIYTLIAALFTIAKTGNQT
jgi:hypothetical protein